MVLSCIENSVIFSFSSWLKEPQLKCFQKELWLPFLGKHYEGKGKLMLFVCHFCALLHRWWTWDCWREYMDLKRSDSVVYIVFLRRKTKLMVEVSSSVHLTAIILFIFQENTDASNSFIFCWYLLMRNKSIYWVKLQCIFYFIISPRVKSYPWFYYL